MKSRFLAQRGPLSKLSWTFKYLDPFLPKINGGPTMLVSLLGPKHGGPPGPLGGAIPVLLDYFGVPNRSPGHSYYFWEIFIPGHPY